MLVTFPSKWDGFLVESFFQRKLGLLHENMICKSFSFREGAIQFLSNPSVHYSRRTWQQNKIVSNTENTNHGRTEEAGILNHYIYSELLKNCKPEGKLILCPSLSFNRLLLNLPFLFFTLGFSWFNWNIMIFSSRSSTSISRSANCCSRRFSNSS